MTRTTTTPRRWRRPGVGSSPSRRAPGSTTSVGTRSTPISSPATRRTSSASRRFPSASPDRSASTGSDAGRLLRSAGDDGGNADRQLQPRHAAADRERRREDGGRRGLHATRPGVHLRGRRRRPRVRSVGRRALRGGQAGRESTTSVGRLQHIGQYQVGPVRYLRFNYTTGDAAGQNMTGKATLAGARGSSRPEPLEYMLSGNVDTDKKHSASTCC